MLVDQFHHMEFGSVILREYNLLGGEMVLKFMAVLGLPSLSYSSSEAVTFNQYIFGSGIMITISLLPIPIIVLTPQ